jgi:hypothetical protein
MFYCSELIFSGLEASGYEMDKKNFTPWDLVKAFKPHYCSTINSSQLQRNIANTIIVE